MPVKNLQITGSPVYPSFTGRSALLMGGSLVKLMVQLTILIWYSRILSVPDYGTYQSVWLFINVFGVLTLFGLPSLLLSAGSSTVVDWIRLNKSRFLSSVLLIHLIPVAYLLFIKDDNSLSTSLWMYALVLAQNFSILRETLAVKNNKHRYLFIVQVGFNLLWLLCHWWVVERGYSLTLLLTLLTALCMVKGIVLPWYQKDTSSINAPTNTGRQWTFLGLFDLVGVMFKWIDKWMILLFISVSQFAIYFNGSYEIPVFPLLVSAAGSVMIVELSGRKFPGTEGPDLFKKCMRFLSIPLFPAFFFLLFYHEPFFLFIFSEKYAEAIPIFLVSLFVIPVRICHFTAGLQAMHRNDIVVKGAFLDLALAIILIFLLYPLLKLPGLALAFVLSTWAQAAYYLYHTARLWNRPLKAFIPLRYLAEIITICFAATVFGKSIGRHIQLDQLVTGVVVAAILSATYFIIHYKKEVRFPKNS